jgi:hypothetical protein
MVVQITTCRSLLSVLKARYLKNYINYEHNTPYTIDRNKNVFTYLELINWISAVSDKRLLSLLYLRGKKNVLALKPRAPTELIHSKRGKKSRATVPLRCTLKTFYLFTTKRFGLYVFIECTHPLPQVAEMSWPLHSYLLEKFEPGHTTLN